jgi:sodium-dependent phosphate cotransporter
MTERTHTSAWTRIGWGLAAILLFMLAVVVMKEGAGSLAPVLQGHLDVSHAADSMGLGWLMAYLILSGSPVAAAAVALLSAGALSLVQTFTMITGSRLGASFIVLLIGFVYALRGHERWTALSSGVLSLLLTGSIQLLALLPGMLILEQGWLTWIQLPALERLGSSINLTLEPLMRPATAALPKWALFLSGVGLVTLSFRLFDRALPQLHLEKTDLGQIPRLIYRRHVMFLLGFFITLITMSVSLSIGILVPLSARGYMRRENLSPYILGANVSTLVDTLAAAVLLGDPRAVAVVLVHMVSTILVSLPIILLAYRPYERGISNALTWITRRRRNFAIFLGIIFAIPAVLILS